MRNLHRGFTIIELLVVVAIIAMLAGLMLTAFSAARQKGRTAGALQQMKGVKNFYDRCVNDKAASGIILTASQFCLPGQATGGCGGAAGDTRNGGNALMCIGSTEQYPNLPLGWIYCDSANSGNCGTDTSNLTNIARGDYVLRAEESGGAPYVLCNETGCTAF